MLNKYLMVNFLTAIFFPSLYIFILEIKREKNYN